MLFSRNKEISAAKLDGEICAFNPSTAKYLTFNTTASEIWDILETPSTLEVIISKIKLTYDINEKQYKEIKEFLEESVKNGLFNCDEKAS